ncbi:MAG: hypothetical protein K2L39_03195, partial [Muribaculaceae bacterium]|nr:hypothetical protein [Muribaculaceae bacterium]
MEGIIATSIPIFICVVLPALIVWIVFRASMNNDNKRAEVLIKAIESNNGIDADRLADALAKPRKTAREILNLRLLRGCIFSFIGLGFFATALFANSEGLHSDNVTIPMLAGSVSLAIGVSYLIVYFVTRKQAGASSE